MKYKQGKHVLVKNMQKQHEQVGERERQTEMHTEPDSEREQRGKVGGGWT